MVRAMVDLSQGVNMSTDVQTILHTFDALPDADKRTIASEILRRSVTLDQQPLSGEQLTEVADELFQELDRQEGDDA